MVGPEGYASGGYTSLDQPRVGGIVHNNLHAIRADERVARLYELVNFAPKLQLRVKMLLLCLNYRYSALPTLRRETLF